MSRKLDLEHITKIEGHAKLYVRVSGSTIERVELRSIEGARFFEGILKDRKFNDVSHISSRICGVCSVVHTITAVRAVEDAFGIKVSDQTDLLRELLNIGGMIQSHVLHLFFLTLPDYAGVERPLDLAKTHKAMLEMSLRLKRLGNKMVFTIAGRDVHPIACVIGGFSRTPSKEPLSELLEDIKSCKKDALETVKIFMSIKYPELKVASPHFSLAGETYFNPHKTIKSSEDACFPVNEYRHYFKDNFREGDPAQIVTKEGKHYLTGALARLGNNINLLSKEAKDFAVRILARRDNPFMNIPAQALEVLEGINRAINILENLDVSDEPPVEYGIMPCDCEGIAAGSAPRGLLFHRYSFDKAGFCTAAEIMTPTSQNLKFLEESIREYLKTMLDKPPAEIKKELEKLIRAFDPCISCSTHFLDLEWES